MAAKHNVTRNHNRGKNDHTGKVLSSPAYQSLSNDISNTDVFTAIMDTGPTSLVTPAMYASANAVTISTVEIATAQTKQTFEHEAYFTN